ncbi:MAG: FAD-dependent oxidoreductase [Pseudomonadota bacterium]
MSRVAVVGAGVLGSAIAWRLAESGHKVRIYDPNPGSAASSGSLAWLNASFAQDPVYNRLRHDSLKIWGRLKAETPDLPIEFDGAILWEQEHFDLHAIHASQQELGLPADILGPSEHLAEEPHVPAPPAQALACRGDGYGDPQAITAWFLDSARYAGAEFVGLDVVGAEVQSGVVTGIRSSAGVERADHVVVAAGIKIPRILEPHGFGIAMDNKPGLLVTTSPAPNAKTHAMLATEGLHGWQGEDGRFLIGADFGGGEDFGDPDAFARALVRKLGEIIPSAAGCEVERITVRERPMPADGRPAIGPLGPQGLYVICTHSGMTLAPVIAEMVAREIGGQKDPRLAPYRPERPSLAP